MISKYFAGLRTIQAVLYIVHCNKVSKPVKGKYLLLCMNSIIYLLLTWYTLIMFLKVLSYLILKITSFMKYFKKGVLNYFKIFKKFLNISKWNISSCLGPYHFCTSLTFSIRSVVSPLGGTEILRENAPPWENAYNLVVCPPKTTKLKP